MLPINFMFWAGLNPVANELLLNINVDGFAILKSLLVVLAAPLSLGFLIQRFLPNVALKLHQILKYLSLLALVAFINFWLLFAVVLAHNALALSLGYLSSSLGHLPVADKKAITLEVGMQNSSLAIAIDGTHQCILGHLAHSCGFIVCGSLSRRCV